MGEINQSIEILWLAESGYHTGSRLREHAHRDYFQVYYILEGTGVFLVNGEEVPFEKDIFFFLAPGVTHGISSVEPSSGRTVRILEAKFALFDSELLENVTELPVVCRGTPQLQSLLYQAFLEGIRKDIHYEKLALTFFAAWLYQVIRLYHDYSPAADPSHFQPKPTTRIKAWLEEHYAEDVSLDLLAEVTGYSKNYLCRIFRENTGTTINHYLTEVRIRKASDLLTRTDLDVAEVGRRCGFNSVHYFINTFKKLIGIPPGSYRKTELTGIELIEGKVESVSSALRTTGSYLTLPD